MGQLSPADEARIAHETRLAEHYFPDRWARARNSKQRATVRKQAVAEEAMGRLRAEGASCRTCAHRSCYPTNEKQPTCDLDTDFYGYALTTMAGLCPRWESRA